MTKERYQSLPVKTLRELAKARGIRGMSTQKKAVIIDAMLELDAREAAAEESGASEAKDASRDMTGGDQAMNSREEDTVSDGTPSESSPTPQQRRVLKIEEPEQAHSFEQAKTESPAGDEKREEKRDKSVYVPGAIPGDQGNTVRGLLEIMTDGFGFLRSANFLPGEEDVYVSPSQIRRFNLKTGDMVEGNKREKAQGEKYGALIYVSRVNDRPADEARRRFTFENMTPIFPNRRIRLERPDGSRATRIVDLISPIGYGQRGMIVSPPKAGKTTLLKEVAKSVKENNPEMHLIIMLIDQILHIFKRCRLFSVIVRNTFGTSRVNAYRLLEDVIDMEDSPAWRSGEAASLRTDDTELILKLNEEPNLSGSLKMGGRISDALVLQYYEEQDDEKAAFGHVLTKEQWQKVSEVKDTYQEILFSTPLLAPNVAHPLLIEVKDELENQNRKFSFLCGHDSNIGSVLASLGAEDYTLPDSIEKKVPIGSKLVFSRWTDADSNAWISVNLVYQTADQLRGLTLLDIDTPPAIFPIALKHLEMNADGLYAAQDVMNRFDQAITEYGEIIKKYEKGDDSASPAESNF